ncbi:protein-glutamate O-methyltransferase CheR [Roseibium salinum]|nr:protein-glutamate O-methyltransferase CheR [Roseibium salinum]
MFLVHRRPIAREVEVGDGERLQICDILRKAVGHDFSGYKSNTMDRRIRRRMQMRGLSSLSDYVEHLMEDGREPSRLFRDLLIGVTQFFRDGEAFVALSERVLAEILEGKTEDDEVRIWVPGCATGEEVYSIAMLLLEKGRPVGKCPRYQDLRQRYRRKCTACGPSRALSAEHCRRCNQGEARAILPKGGRYIRRPPPHVREICLFAQHNLLRDPPFSRIDLISCRNVLIYMDSALQKRLIPVFHYALRPNGILFMGPAENAGPNQKLFTEVERKHRIYRRIGESSRLPDFPIAAGDGKERGRQKHKERGNESRARNETQHAAQRLLERYSPAHVIVDSDFEILEASSGTGAFLELPRGRPNSNLAAMVRSELAIDIKSAVSQVLTTGKKLVRSDLTVETGQNRKHLTLSVEPLPADETGRPLCLVLFPDRQPRGS